MWRKIKKLGFITLVSVVINLILVTIVYNEKNLEINNREIFYIAKNKEDENKKSYNLLLNDKEFLDIIDCGNETVVIVFKNQQDSSMLLSAKLDVKGNSVIQSNTKIKDDLGKSTTYKVRNVYRREYEDSNAKPLEVSQE
jgi:hypothetical protein